MLIFSIQLEPGLSKVFEKELLADAVDGGSTGVAVTL